MVEEIIGLAPSFTIGDKRYEAMEILVERDTSMRDFYNSYNALDITPENKKAYSKFSSKLSMDEKAFLDAGHHYYSIQFENRGGLVMPIILEFQFIDGTSEIVRVPVQIWQKNKEEISKVFFFEKEIEKIVLYPLLETADTERNNNYWPETREPTGFELYKRSSRRRGGSNAGNPMQRANQRQQAADQSGQ